MDNINGMDKYKRDFDKSIDEIIALIDKGRSIEVLYKIVDEICLQESIIKNTGFNDFVVDNFKRDFNRIAIDRFKITEEEFIIFNNIQNTLAHGDLFGACFQILKYESKFGLETTVTSKKIGHIYLHNVRDDDGTVSDQSAFIEPFKNESNYRTI